MTKEEAISIMKVIVHMLEEKYDTDRVEDAVDMAIKALEQEPCEDCISRKVVLDLVEDMTDQFGTNHRVVTEGMISLLPSVTPKPKTEWIPVSERLPELHNYMQEYLVTIKGKFIRTAFFTETNGKSWWSIDNVIAWMPLPYPYKAESRE